MIWQFQHDWPQLTVAGGISEDDGTENRIMFVPLQILQLSPFLVPIWIAGFLRLWRMPWARSVALAYPLLCVVVLAVGGKSYYALPLLLVLVAAGCEPALRCLDRSPPHCCVIGFVLTALTSALFTLPVLPASAVDFVIPVNKEQGEQIGWPTLTATVATAWERIPPDQRSSATIVRRQLRRSRRVAPLRAVARTAPGVLRSHELRRLGPPARHQHRPGPSRRDGADPIIRGTFPRLLTGRHDRQHRLQRRGRHGSRPVRTGPPSPGPRCGRN